MKIALINPPLVCTEESLIPLWMLMLGGEVRKEHDVCILDLNFEEDRRKLESIDADVIGITCMTSQRDYVKELSERLKRDKKAWIVVGGAHPTIAPEDMLQSTSIDYAIRGDGEIAFHRLVNALEQEKPVNEITGLCYKNGGMIVQSDISYIENLDELPFPSYDLIDVHRYPSMPPWTLNLPYESSRGCPYNCIFCSANKLKGRKYRVMSVERILRDFEKIVDMYSGDRILILFNDLDFTLSRKRVIDFCNSLMEKKWRDRVGLSCMTRATDLDGNLIKKMKNAGLIRAFIGGEAGYQRGLDLIRKGYRVQDIQKAAEICLKNKLITMVSFIIGFPWEKVSDMKKTLSFAIKLEEKGANTALYSLTPFPGTPLWDYLRQKRIAVQDGSSKDLDFLSEKLAFNHPYVSDKQMNGILKTFERVKIFLHTDIKDLKTMLKDTEG